MTTGNGFGTASKIKQVGRMDLPGGGKIEVDKGFAYVGHMDPPHGTSVIDVRDPRNVGIESVSSVPRPLRFRDRETKRLSDDSQLTSSHMALSGAIRCRGRLSGSLPRSFHPCSRPRRAARTRRRTRAW